MLPLAEVVILEKSLMVPARGRSECVFAKQSDELFLKRIIEHTQDDLKIETACYIGLPERDTSKLNQTSFYCR